MGVNGRRIIIIKRNSSNSNNKRTEQQVQEIHVWVRHLLLHRPTTSRRAQAHTRQRCNHHHRPSSTLMNRINDVDRAEVRISTTARRFLGISGCSTSRLAVQEGEEEEAQHRRPFHLDVMVIHQ